MIKKNIFNQFKTRSLAAKIFLLFLYVIIATTTFAAEDDLITTNIYDGKPGKVVYHMANIHKDKRSGLYYSEQIEYLGRLLTTDPMYEFFTQYSATYASFIGKLDYAIATFDKVAGYYIDIPTNLDSTNAIDYIEQASKSHRIIMINEAHHVTAHRWLTYKLLDRLAKQGYTYLALEAISENGVKQIEKDGYYSGGNGIYTNEPFFSALINHAVALGFEIVAYDSNDDNREYEAAKNLLSRIDLENSDTKVIVHVGYSHIEEQKWLASHLKTMSGLEPLTVNQASFCNGCINYLDAVSDSPQVLLKKNGIPWVAKERYYDLSVYWPKSVRTNKRDSWYFEDHTAVKIDKSICKGIYPCLLEVVYSDKPIYIITDRYLLENPENSVVLKAPQSPYHINAYDKEGSLISE